MLKVSQLHLAGIANIIGIVLVLISMPFAFFEEQLSPALHFSVFGIEVLYALSYLIVSLGFITIARQTKNKLIEIASWALLLVTFAQTGLSPVTRILRETLPVIDLLYLLALPILGACVIMFGIGFLQIKKQFGQLATAIGVCNIVAGVSFVLIVLAPIGLLLIIPILIMETVVLFQARNVLQSDNN